MILFAGQADEITSLERQVALRFETNESRTPDDVKNRVFFRMFMHWRYLTQLVTIQMEHRAAD